MRIIDGHCHVGKGIEKSLSPERLIEIMDENGVEKSVICPIEQYIAVYNEEGNAYIAETVKRYPDRFIGFASVNPWYLSRGEDLLKRALDSGLRGLKLNPKLQGFQLCDEVVYGVVRIAETYRVPVFAHTGTMVCAEPFQLRELAKLFPKVNFIMGHSGNTDFWTDVENAVKGCDNLYLDTSHNLSVGRLIAAAGADRVIFGANMPRSHQTHEVKRLMQQGLDDVTLQKICCDNILRLVGEQE
jgi:predicted TIM-barrel fold metal-dependent hydrolase